MSSYLINSNYVDPKFPPCEEYSQSDYLPQSLSGLLQLPEAGARCLSAGLSLPPLTPPPAPAPPEPPPATPAAAAIRAAIHAVPARRTACLRAHVPPESRSPSDHHQRSSRGAEPPLRVGDTQPSSASVLWSNAPQPKLFFPRERSEGSHCLPLDEESPCKHREPKLLRGRTQAFTDGLHTPAGLGAGEGVPLQSVPDAQAQSGDSPHSLSIGAPDQNMVSKPEDEMEKRPQAAQHQGPLRV